MDQKTYMLKIHLVDGVLPYVEFHRPAPEAAEHVIVRDENADQFLVYGGNISGYGDYVMTDEKRAEIRAIVYEAILIIHNISAHLEKKHG